MKALAWAFCTLTVAGALFFVISAALLVYRGEWLHALGIRILAAVFGGDVVVVWKMRVRLWRTQDD